MAKGLNMTSSTLSVNWALSSLEKALRETSWWLTVPANT